MPITMLIMLIHVHVCVFVRVLVFNNRSICESIGCILPCVLLSLMLPCSGAFVRAHARVYVRVRVCACACVHARARSVMGVCVRA